MTAAADIFEKYRGITLIVMLLIIVNICSFVKSVFIIFQLFLDILNRIAHNINCEKFYIMRR